MKIAIHKCGEIAPVIRDATAEEEAAVMDKRNNPELPQIDRVAAMEARIKALEESRTAGG